MSTDDYSWISDDVLEGAIDVAACFTLVRGRSVNDVLAAFGADLGEEVLLEDAYGDGEKGFISVFESGDGVVAVEYNGFKGSLPEVLVSLSLESALAASMFWNVEDLTMFTCAQDGRLVASADMYDSIAGSDVALPSELQPLFDEAGNEGADLHAIGVSMASHFTGVSLAREDLEAVRTASPYRMG